MSKSITVPDIGFNPIRLQINNKIYELIPGATMTVPDEVAALLSQIAGAKPQEDPDIADKQYATLGQVKALIEDTAELPAVTSTDNGDVLTVVSGAWAKADAPSGLPEVSATDNGKFLGVSNGAWGAVDAAPLHVPFTVTVGEGGVLSATTTAVYADVRAAYAAGRTVDADVTLPGGGAVLRATTVTAYSAALQFDCVAAISQSPPMLYQIAYSTDSVVVGTTELRIAE